jgi:hypothetical protein
VAKQAITQRSFNQGVLDEEFLDSGPNEVRLTSLRGGSNVMIRGSGSINDRPGTRYVRVETDGIPMAFGVKLPNEAQFVIRVWAGKLGIFDSTGTQVYSTTSFVADQASAWVAETGYKVIVGSSAGMYVLTYASGSWSIAAFAFDTAPGNELAQPYWSFVGGLTLTPSALTGSITVTASAALFSASWIGMRIRYAYREILITAYTSATQVTGTVISELPPTYRITMTSTVGFLVNDVVVGDTTGFQGLIVAVSGSDIDVLTLNYFGGPDASEKLSTSTATTTVAKKATSRPGDFKSKLSSGSVSSKTVISPAASPVWDEPLMSPVRGWPRSGSVAAGRIFLCGFPQATDAIAASSVRSAFDFRVGDEDDDGLARAVGEDSPIFRHVISAGDVIILSDRGCYMISVLDGGVVTPSNFSPILFDPRGASTVRPAKLDNSVVFIEDGTDRVAIAQLSGNIYQKWIARTLSMFRGDLFSHPTFLAGPPINGILNDKYLLVGNDDGTMAVMSWPDALDLENVGFVLWETNGSFETATSMGGEHYVFVTRTIAGVEKVLCEKISGTAIMDCQLSGGSSLLSNFNGQELDIAGAGWDGGTVTIASDEVPNLGDYPADAAVGFNFISSAMPWPQNLVQHPKAGLLPARVIRVAMSVIANCPLQIRCNNTTRSFGGYSFGDDLSEVPPEQKRLYRTSVVGRRDHPEIEIIKPRPGSFQILSVTQEVAL